MEVLEDDGNFRVGPIGNSLVFAEVLPSERVKVNFYNALVSLERNLL